MKAFDKIYDLVSSIPKGKVTTYGAIAKIAGVDPRVVGFALHANKDPQNIPCHRVIKANGKIAAGYAFGGPHIQKRMLEKEGIKFSSKDDVDFIKFGFLI